MARARPIVVAVTGAPGSAGVIHRAAELAAGSGARLAGVHVTRPDGTPARRDAALDEHHQLLRDLGGDYHEVIGDDIADALVTFARAEDASLLVLGAGGRPSWAERRAGTRWREPLVAAVLRRADAVDVHVVRSTAPSPDLARHGAGRGPRPRLPRRRRVAAWVLVGAGIPALTLLLDGLRSNLNLTSGALLYLLVVTLTAVVGGFWPGLAAAVASSLALNWFFTPPLHTLFIGSGENLLAFATFVAVAVLVSTVVSQATRRGAAAARARAEAQALARVAGSLVGDDDGVGEMVVLLHTTFGLDGVTVLEPAPPEHDGDEPGWAIVHATGSAVARHPSDGLALPLTDPAVLVLQGGTLTPDDRYLLEVFAAQVGSALERRRLRTAAAEATALAQTDRLRTAILRAVSHDLRSPLASIKASVTSMLQADVAWSAEDRREFLVTIDEESDRLNTLVGNLLDMSRIEAGAIAVSARPVALEEVVARALASLSGSTAHVEVDVSERIAPARADAVLLERALANLVSNALRFSPPGRAVRIEAAAAGARVRLAVIDHGPGVGRAERTAVLAPFQRLGDQEPGSGVGLGLPVAKGFVEAMGGGLAMSDTPGGGLTVTIDLPAVEGGGAEVPAEPREGTG